MSIKLQVVNDGWDDALIQNSGGFISKPLERIIDILKTENKKDVARSIIIEEPYIDT